MQAKDDAAASSNSVAAGSSSHIDDEMERALVDFLLKLKSPAHLVWAQCRCFVSLPVPWHASLTSWGRGVTGLQMQRRHCLMASALRRH